MFDLSGIKLKPGSKAILNQYRDSETTNYPGNFVCFAERFSDWLVGKRGTPTLGIVDLIEVMREWSCVKVEIAPEPYGTLITARAPQGSELAIDDRVFFAAES